MKKITAIAIIIFSCVLSQDRSILFNTGGPAYTCNSAGGAYSNYTCDNACDLLVDYCTVLLDGYTINSNNTLANQFIANNNYALEAFGVYLTLDADADLSLAQSATVKISEDNNDSPGEVLGEWTIDITSAFYYNLYVGDGCIDLDAGSRYWISVHVEDTPYTQLKWLYTQSPFYTFSQTSNNGSSWEESEFGIAGASAIWAEQIYYTDWQPAQSADVNLDGDTNVLDVVQLAQFILENVDFNEDQIANSDFNQDGAIDIIDVVGIVNLILTGNTPELMPEFSLEDINPNSEYYGNYIGPETFREDVSLYYFGKAG